MTAAALALLFVVAKAAVLAGSGLPFTVWSAIAMISQDALIVVIVALLERLTPPKRVLLALYSAIAIWVVINVPVERTLGSPITLQMLRATSGTIGGSFAHSFTVPTIAAMVVVAGTALFGPTLIRALGVPRPVGVALLIAMCVCIAVGPAAARRTENGNIGRNVIIAFVQSAVSRVAPVESDDDWRRSTAPPGEDWTALRGSARGTNVLFVVLESTAAEYLRINGAADDPMPNLTVLSRSAMIFENAYTAYPESVKGMVAYLASRYPAFDVGAQRHSDIVAPSIASVLRANGYATALFHSGRFAYLDMDSLVARSGFATQADAGDIGGEHNSSFGIDEPSTVGALLRWIDSVPRGTPFFAAYLPIAGHHPYAHDSAGPWPDTDDFGRYRNALHEGDVALGTLFTELHRRGLDTNTTVVVFGDHGEAFGKHPGNFAHTLAIYDENVHVPFFIVAPHTNPLRTPKIASLLDIAPTTLDLLGIDIPDEFDGVSLLDPEPQAALFLTDYATGLLGARDGCDKFIYEIESKRARLFDLCTDPDERTDLSAEKTDLVKRYQSLLLRWSAAQVDLLTRPAAPTRSASR